MVIIDQYQVKPEIFDNPIFSIQLKGMRYFGYLIGTNQRYPLWHFIRCTFFTISYVFFVALNCIKVFRRIQIIEADFILRPTTLGIFSAAIYIVNGYFQRKRVFRLINYMHEDLVLIRSYDDDLEQEMYKKLVKYLRRVTKSFLITANINGGFACLQCLVTSILYPDLVFNQILTNQKPNGTVIPILLESYPFHDVLINAKIGYVGSYYAMVMSTLSVPLTHTLGTSLLEFLNFKIEIINKRVSEMDIKKSDYKLRNPKKIDMLTSDELNFMRLKMCEYCAKEQVKIRWFVEELQQLLRIPLFMDFVIFTLLFCVLAYPMSTGLLRGIEYVYVFLFIANMAVIQSLYHWPATVLRKNHEAMTFAIYSCDWYNYPLKVQKTILLLMTESSKPLVITALIIELKLQTVLDIFRGAFSYFSVLRKFTSKKPELN